MAWGQKKRISSFTLEQLITQLSLKKSFPLGAGISSQEQISTQPGDHDFPSPTRILKRHPVLIESEKISPRRQEAAGCLKFQEKRTECS